MDKVEYYFNQGLDGIIAYLPQLLLALITLFIGFKLIGLLIKLLKSPV